LKILNIHSIGAGTPIIAKFLRKRGHLVEVLTRVGSEPWGIGESYGERKDKGRTRYFYLKCLLHARNYDIIHIHDYFHLVSPFRTLYRRKKIILEYHGTSLRITPEKIRKKVESKCNRILVSTPDLLDYGNYLLNRVPVDMDHFAPRKIPKNNSGLIFIKGELTPVFVEKFLKSKGFSIKLDSVIKKQKKIPYKDMPSFLSEYEYYVDIWLHQGKPVNALSGTALQALALGLKVIRGDLNIIDKFPEEHLPEKVVDKLEKVYLEC